MSGNEKTHSLTHIWNMGFDENHQLPVVELTGVDANGDIRTVPVNTDGTLKIDSLPTAGNNPQLVIDDSDPNVAVFTKTIGGVNYRKTITTSGTTTTFSPWSQI